MFRFTRLLFPCFINLVMRTRGIGSDSASFSRRTTTTQLYRLESLGTLGCHCFRGIVHIPQNLTGPRHEDEPIFPCGVPKLSSEFQTLVCAYG